MPKAYKALPPASELWERFEYKPLTGELVWRTNRLKSLVGRQAGCVDQKGYRRLKLGNIDFKVHRVIWCWFTGFDPVGLEIDHKDGNPLNNCWNNLRLATSLQNSQNRPSKGYRYLYREGRNKNWLAVVHSQGKYFYNGYHATEQEARLAGEELKSLVKGDWRR